MKTLVFGGSTFIGLRTAMELHARGHDVSVLNRGVTPVNLPEGVTRLVADRTDNESVRNALEGKQWDAVFDVSGFVMVAGGSDFDYLINLLDGNVGHYVYCSSIMAYSPSTEFPWHEDQLLTDEPAGTYGGFKATVERKLLARHAETGFPVTTIRPAAVYGPNNNIYDMEAAMFLRLLQGRPVLVPHEGLVVCSYGHVDDLVRLMIDAAESDEAVGEAFNATADAVTVNHYVDTIAKIVGKEADVLYVPPDITAKNPFGLCSHLFGVFHHSELSMAKAERILDFQWEYDFRSGHQNTFDWFMESGLAEADEALRDPLWGASYNFELEAEVAQQIRSRSA
ncbi:MAG TPA: NAD-dependent epimerase/dehydratase family protein [Dehalococcoidia bacterium]|nr:NAD-dependent epimerase/dehydratase family protein [Dehalococcoidia bacterium]